MTRQFAMHCLNLRDSLWTCIRPEVISEEFPITCGPKQIYVLAFILFYLYLAAMLHRFPPDNPVVDIRYRYDGGHFSLSRLRSKRLRHTQHISEIKYADDNAALCHSNEEFQQPVKNFVIAYPCFLLTVNIKKTKVCAQPAHLARFWYYYLWYTSRTIRVFSISRQPFIKHVHHKKGCGTQNWSRRYFAKLIKRVFNNKHRNLATKLLSIRLLSFHLCYMVEKLAHDFQTLGRFTCRIFVQSWISNEIICPTPMSWTEQAFKEPNRWSLNTAFFGHNMLQEWRSQAFNVKSYSVSSHPEKRPLDLPLWMYKDQLETVKSSGHEQKIAVPNADVPTS